MPRPRAPPLRLGGRAAGRSGTAGRPRLERALRTACRGPRAEAEGAGASSSSPLVIDRGPIFGVLQIEGAAPRRSRITCSRAAVIGKPARDSARSPGGHRRQAGGRGGGARNGPAEAGRSRRAAGPRRRRCGSAARRWCRATSLERSSQGRPTRATLQVLYRERAGPKVSSAIRARIGSRSPTSGAAARRPDDRGELRSGAPEDAGRRAGPALRRTAVGRRTRVACSGSAAACTWRRTAPERLGFKASRVDRHPPRRRWKARSTSSSSSTRALTGSIGEGVLAMDREGPDHLL